MNTTEEIRIPLIPRSTAAFEVVRDAEATVVSAVGIGNFNCGFAGALFPINIPSSAISSASMSIMLKEPVIFGPLVDVGVRRNNLGKFIGMLSEPEAEAMKKEVKLFRKEFGNDIDERGEILFGK